MLLCCLTCAPSPPLLPLLLFKLLSFGTNTTLLLLLLLLPTAFTCSCVTSAPLAGFTSPRFGWYGWLPNTSGP